MKGWIERPLSQLLTATFDGVWGKELTGSNGVSVLRSTDMRASRLSFQHVAQRDIPRSILRSRRLLDGDILVNKSSGSAHLVGASVIFFAPDNNIYTCSNFIRCLRSDHEEIDPEFLHLSLQSPQFRSQVYGAHHTTSGLRNLKISEYLGATIPHPRVGEQRRIVARVKQCMERVEEIERLDAAVAHEASALFPALVQEQFCRLSDTAVPRRLDDVADIRGGASLPEGRGTDGGNKKSVLLLKVGDMNEPGNERVIASSRAYLPIAQAGRGVINAGATLFPKRGGAITTNKKRLLARPALLDPNLMAIEPLDGKTLAGYLYYWSQTLDLPKIANGAIIPQINRKDLAPIRLPVPDIRTQRAIVGELEEAEAACAQLVRNVQKSMKMRAPLREAILRKAFAGEL